MIIPLKKYSKNAFIYISDKTPPKEFYIVKSGKIKITRPNILIGDVEEIRTTGFIFGIIQCFTGTTQEETVLTMTDCEVFVISKDLIEDVFVNHKKVIMKILSEYSEILRKLDADLINFDFFPSETNRKEKVFEIAQKYIKLKQNAKAIHLLSSIIQEFPSDQAILTKAKALLQNNKTVKPILDDKDIFYETVVPGNTVIFTEFELGTNFFIIKKGKVKITKLKSEKEVLLAILGDGDIFGEMSILNDKPRNAAAVAVEETILMVIDKKGIEKLPPPIFSKLLEFLSKRIWLVQQQLICYKLPSPNAKLYYMLTSKIKQVIHNLEEEKGNSFVFKFPVEELYQMINYEFDPKNREDIVEFLEDNNLDFFPDAIKVRHIGDLFSKNIYHFSRAMLSYNSAKKSI
jgi:CRP-like cAMP-binding protein